MTDRPSELVVKLFGWTLRIDPYGLSLFDVHRFEADADAAEHDCGRDHPDGACDAQDAAFRLDDLADLFFRARDGEHPYELLAEFHAGVRADPERPT